jgi:putative transposase
MFLIRGIVFSYEAIRDWEAKLTPALAEALRRRRRGKIGRSWYVDETYVNVQGRRQCPRPLVLSVSRHRHVGRAGGREAERNTRHGGRHGVLPIRPNGDRHHAGRGHDRRTRQLSESDPDRTRRKRAPSDQSYLNNRIEQDHRGIKGRYQPMRGFKSRASAARFCRSYDELRNFLHSRSSRNQHVPANHRRLHVLCRSLTAISILEAA